MCRFLRGSTQPIESGMRPKEGERKASDVLNVLVCVCLCVRKIYSLMQNRVFILPNKTSAHQSDDKVKKKKRKFVQQ